MNQELIFTIVAIVAFVGLIAALYYNGKVKIAKQIVLQLVIRAEEYYGSGAGKVKFQAVLGQVYALLPGIVKFFVTQAMIEQWIEDAVQYIKNELMKDEMTIERYLCELNRSIN